MRQWILYLLVGTISLTTVAVVAGAGVLTVSKTVNLKGSPEATWSLVGDYCAMRDWHPGVLKCEIVSGTANRAGAVRVLTVKEGTVREELTKYDASAHTYSYKMLESPLPVVSYTGSLTVRAGSNGGSIVEWKAAFKAGPNTDDVTARTTVEGIYDAGLANLQAKDAKK